jgi:hypothetical protein
MTDVFVLLLIFYLLLRNYAKERNRYYVLGIAGAVSIFLSNVAPIILFTAGLYLFYTDFFVLKRKKIVPLFIVFAVWLGVFGVYYYFFIYEHPIQGLMLEYWSKEELIAFLPYNSLSEFLNFLQNKSVTILGILFNRRGVAWFFEIIVLLIFLSAFLAGLLSLILKKRIGIIILTCTPPLLHAFLSALQMYPFEVRLFLYILPGVMIICSIGFVFILKFIFTYLKIEKYLAGKCRLFILLFPLLLFLSEYPVKIKKHEIRESIRYIKENREEGENVYAYMHAIMISKYYVAIGFAPPIKQIELPPFAKRLNDNEFLDQLEELQGKHWLLCVPISSIEEPNIWNDKYTIAKADSCYKRLKTFETTGAAAYLYDFGE